MSLQDMNITVRELSTGDGELVNEFFDGMCGETRALFNRRDYNRRRALKYCKSPDKTRKYYLFERDGAMVALLFFLGFHTTVPELGLAVRDELRGKGLGGEIMRFAIDTARSEGAGAIELTTHTANLRAQALYEKHGFECMGLAKNGTELYYRLRFLK